LCGLDHFRLLRSVILCGELLFLLNHSAMNALLQNAVKTFFGDVENYPDRIKSIELY
jgi:hypothetical protein